MASGGVAGGVVGVGSIGGDEEVEGGVRVVSCSSESRISELIF